MDASTHDAGGDAIDMSGPWTPGPSLPGLPAGHIHVWRASESLLSRHVDSLSLSLSDDERDHAANFRRDEDRRRFILCRGILRDVLGRYLSCRPGDLRFKLSEFGKPSLATTDAPIEFNVSHTHGMGLLAFSIDNPVGVDVEAIRDTPDFAAIGRRFLHPSEWAAIAAAPPAMTARRFFECWTAKEACLKADGRGLSAGPESLRIDPATPIAGSEAAGINVAAESELTAYWIGALNVGPGFAGAVASALRPSHRRDWDWNPIEK